MRKSGLLLHISSLPGAGGIGTLGQEAYDFADFLKKSGMSIWQVLPMGPTGYGESPYQSSSVFAGNPMLISLQTLADEGLLTLNPGDLYTPTQDAKVEFDAVRWNKEGLLRRAFEECEEKLSAELADFVKTKIYHNITQPIVVEKRASATAVHSKICCFYGWS